MLDINYYEKYGGVSEYLKHQKLIRNMGTNPTDAQRLERYRWIDKQKNPDKKITDFARIGG